MSGNEISNFSYQLFSLQSSQLVKTTGGEMRIVGGHTLDLYYMPMKYLQNYTKILNVFFKDLVFTELAVATVQVCLENRKQTQVN